VNTVTGKPSYIVDKGSHVSRNIRFQLVINKFNTWKLRRINQSQVKKRLLAKYLGKKENWSTKRRITRHSTRCSSAGFSSSPCSKVFCQGLMFSLLLKNQQFNHKFEAMCVSVARNPGYLIERSVIEPNRTPIVRLGSVIEHNRTHGKSLVNRTKSKVWLPNGRQSYSIERSITELLFVWSVFV